MPDLVYLPDYYNVVNLVTRQAREKGVTASFLGSDGWDSPDLDLKAADGGYFTNHFSPNDPRPEVRNFRKAYSAAYKDDKGRPKIPDAFAALAYDAANLLLNAIQKAGVDDPDQVRIVLSKAAYNGVTGKISFDLYHNPVKSVTILHIDGGRIVFDSVVNP